MNAITAMITPLQRASGKAARVPATFQVGAVFGEWTVESYTPAKRAGKTVTSALCACRCSCGVRRDVRAHNLASGASKSCGHRTSGRPPGSGT